MKKILVFILLILFIETFNLMTASNVQSMTLEFTGDITYVYNNYSVLDDSVIVGGSFTGTYTFDTITGDVLSFEAEVGSYFGARSFRAIDPYFDIRNNTSIGPSPGDIYSVNSWETELIDGYLEATYMAMVLIDYGIDAPALDSNDFTVIPNPLDFTTKREFQISGNSGGSYQITGEVDSITQIDSVPIPGGIWLLGSGLIAIVGISQRLKKT